MRSAPLTRTWPSTAAADDPICLARLSASSVASRSSVSAMALRPRIWDRCASRSLSLVSSSALKARPSTLASSLPLTMDSSSAVYADSASLAWPSRSCKAESRLMGVLPRNGTTCVHRQMGSSHVRFTGTLRSADVPSRHTHNRGLLRYYGFDTTRLLVAVHG